MVDAPPPPLAADGDWHLKTGSEVLRAQRTDPASGLSPGEAARRLAERGPNELATQQAPPWPALLLDQFKDFMILVLLAAALVSGALGEWIDTLVIRLDRDFCTHTGITSRGLDFQQTIIDFRHFHLEKLDDELGGRTRKN